MQGIYLNGRRPKSKKEIRERIAQPGGMVAVEIEATSMFSGEYSGPVADAPNGTYSFVGPCPHTSRKFYGHIVKSGDRVQVK